MSCVLNTHPAVCSAGRCLVCYRPQRSFDGIIGISIFVLVVPQGNHAQEFRNRRPQGHLKIKGEGPSNRIGFITGVQVFYFHTIAQEKCKISYIHLPLPLPALAKYAAIRGKHTAYLYFVILAGHAPLATDTDHITIIPVRRGHTVGAAEGEQQFHASYTFFPGRKSSPCNKWLFAFGWVGHHGGALVRNHMPYPGLFLRLCRLCKQG